MTFSPRSLRWFQKYTFIHRRARIGGLIGSNGFRSFSLSVICHLMKGGNRILTYSEYLSCSKLRRRACFEIKESTMSFICLGLGRNKLISCRSRWVVASLFMQEHKENFAL